MGGKGKIRNGLDMETQCTDKMDNAKFSGVQVKINTNASFFIEKKKENIPRSIKENQDRRSPSWRLCRSFSK